MCGTSEKLSGMRDEIPIQSCVLVIVDSSFFFFPCGMRFVKFSGSGFEDNFYRMCIALLYVWSLLYIYMKVYSLMVCA